MSATHTSEMDANDQDDIIKKVKEAGNNNDNEDNTNDSRDNNNNSGSNDDGSNSEFTGSVGGNDHAAPSSTSPSSTGMAENVEEKEEESIFLKNPKKNNMFQPGSNDILKESCWKGYKAVGMKEKDGKQVPNCVPIDEVLHISKKSSIFAKSKIKSKLQETFNQEDEMSEPMVEPAVKPAPVKTPKKQPNIAPSRKNKPFLPMPEVQPDPKGVAESFDFADSERNFHDKEEMSDLQKYVGKEIKIKNSNKIIGLITPDKSRYFSILKSLKNEINNMRIQNNIVVASDSQDTQWLFDILGVDENNIYLEFTGTAK